MKRPSIAERTRRAVIAFLDGYRGHMVYPREGRISALWVGLYRARTYLHNTSRRWPGCACEMHRRDGHRFNPYDKRRSA